MENVLLTRTILNYSRFDRLEFFGREHLVENLLHTSSGFKTDVARETAVASSFVLSQSSRGTQDAEEAVLGTFQVLEQGSREVVLVYKTGDGGGF